MAYELKNFRNDSTPPLSAENLNDMDKGIEVSVNGEKQNHTNAQTEDYNAFGSGQAGYVDLTSLFSISGKALNQSGVITNNVNGTATDFIRVRPGEVYSIALREDLAYTYGVCYYDEVHTFISGVHVATESYVTKRDTFTVPSGVSYMRCSSLGVYLLLKSANAPIKTVVGDIKEALGNIYGDFKDITEDAITGGERGKYLDTNGNVAGSSSSTSANLLTDYIPVSEGTIFSYYLEQLYGNTIYCIYDSQKNKVSYYKGTNGEAQSGTVTIPAQGYYIRFSTMAYPSVFNIKKKIVTPILNQIGEIKERLEGFDLNTSLIKDLEMSVENGYLMSNDTANTSSSWRHTDYIDLLDYEWIASNVFYGYNAVGYLILNENKSVLAYLSDANTQIHATVKLITSEVLEDYPTARYIRFSGDTDLKVFSGKFTNDIEYSDALMSCGNILYKKKIAFCGDSFTAGDNLGAANKDFYWNCYKSYAWFIANRNNMNLYLDGVGGSTMHITNESSPNTDHPFSNTRYQNVPEDCDYIILQFGLNEFELADSAETLGTRDSTDKTTMWGSWNVVLEYLIENHPTAKIGVIMPDAWMKQTYYEALKEICEWWGIPLLDLGGDANISLNINGRRSGCGLTLNPRAKALRDATFCQTFNSETQVATDSHPNLEGHKWRSTIIEHWIRGL